jgi:hypothetical protein
MAGKNGTVRMSSKNYAGIQEAIFIFLKMVKLLSIFTCP